MSWGAIRSSMINASPVGTISRTASPVVTTPPAVLKYTSFTMPSIGALITVRETLSFNRGIAFSISSFSDNTSPIAPIPLPISAFKILYLSPLKLKKAPGEGNKPFILPTILRAFSFQLIFPSVLFNFFA